MQGKEKRYSNLGDALKAVCARLGIRSDYPSQMWIELALTYLHEQPEFTGLTRRGRGKRVARDPKDVALIEELEKIAVQYPKIDFRELVVQTVELAQGQSKMWGDNPDKPLGAKGHITRLMRLKEVLDAEKQEKALADIIDRANRDSRNGYKKE